LTAFVSPTVDLLRIDGCPLQGDELSFQLKSWLAVLADTLNTTFDILQPNINVLNSYVSAQGISVPKLTAVQIAALTGLPDGILLYDTTNNVYVGRQSGALVKFTTTAYP